MTPSAFYLPQLALTGLMAVVGLYNMVRPGGNPFTVFHFADLATSLLGHLAFSLFGSFAAYLGGPVVQVAFPLSLFTYLASLQKPFFAALALFWAAHSLVGVSLYVRDARALTFELYYGSEHLWNRLLFELELLRLDRFLGGLLHLGGALILVAALGLALLASRSNRRLPTSFPYSPRRNV